MTRLLVGAMAVAAWWVWWPFPAPGADPLADLVAFRSPRLLAAVRTWHYLAPGVFVVGAWSVVVAVHRVWFAGGARGSGRGKLPRWPIAAKDPAPAVVVGEVHHPTAVREVSDPSWLTIPERGLYTGVAIFGAVGSGKTSGCMRPFAQQLLSWQAQDPRKRAAGLVLEVKGDFCHQVRGILEAAGRGEDYVELGLGGRWQWNPLGDHNLDSSSLAYTIASLINQLYGRGKDPFWQQAYVDLVRWIIELHRMTPDRWVTLRDVYRCTLSADAFEAKLAEVAKLVEPPKTVRIGSTDFAAHAAALSDGWGWERVGDESLRTADDPRLREKLAELGVAFALAELLPADPVRREQLAAVRLWYENDWLQLDPKLQSSIVKGLSVFLSVFDMPDVASVFCPPPPARETPVEEPLPEGAAPPTAGVGLLRRLPDLDELIDGGKVLCLNMPAGRNPGLSRVLGVMLKQAWLQTLLRRPAQLARRPAREQRPAVFLCDEYQSFASVGENDPSGDEKMFALTRQSRLIPIVATQSISSLRSVLGQSEAWRTLLQTLRTRIFLSLSDDASAQSASTQCGQVAKMKASYTVSEQTSRAGASLLSGSAGGGTGSVGASKAFSERREPLFHPRDFTVLDNYQAIVIPYDGRRTLDARRVYLKPYFLPRDRPYWRAHAAGEI